MRTAKIGPDLRLGKPLKSKAKQLALDVDLLAL